MDYYYSFDHLYSSKLKKLLEDCDYECSPRGSFIKEDLAVTFCLTNPRNRICNSQERNANYGFAVGEFLWYLRGANDVESISYYNKRMPSFSDDGLTINSAYGKRIGIDKPFGQWQQCVHELIHDMDSRRAVMTIYNASDLARVTTEGTKDVPCTLTLQFLIRDGELNLHAHMRSNDIVWGLPYDLFSFTMLQEVMLLELRSKGLDLTLGKYYHTAGSLHLYQRHFEMAKEVVEEYRADPIATNQMPQLKNLDELNTLIIFEKLLREDKITKINENSFDDACVKYLAITLNKHKESRRQDTK